MTREFKLFGLAVVKNRRVSGDLFYRVNVELVAG